MEIQDKEDDDNVGYFEYEEFLKNHTNNSKQAFFDELEEIGDKMIQEKIDKDQRNNIEKKKLIKKILKHNNIHSESELLLYTFADVRDIYTTEVKEKKNIFTKIFHFILGYE